MSDYKFIDVKPSHLHHKKWDAIFQRLSDRHQRIISFGSHNNLDYPLYIKFYKEIGRAHV